MPMLDHYPVKFRIPCRQDASAPFFGFCAGKRRYCSTLVNERPLLTYECPSREGSAVGLRHVRDSTHPRPLQGGESIKRVVPSPHS